MAQQGDVFFKPDKIVQIPTKDILSWIFDELGYDPERPVRSHSTHQRTLRLTLRLRSILTPLNPILHSMPENAKPSSVD